MWDLVCVHGKRPYTYLRTQIKTSKFMQSNKNIFPFFSRWSPFIHTHDNDIWWYTLDKDNNNTEILSQFLLSYLKLPKYFNLKTWLLSISYNLYFQFNLSFFGVISVSCSAVSLYMPLFHYNIFCSHVPPLIV